MNYPSFQGCWQGVVFAGVAFFNQEPLLRQKLVKWFLSSKVVFAIYLRPRTCYEHLRVEGTWCVIFVTRIYYIRWRRNNNLQFKEHQFVPAAFKQDDRSSSQYDS